MPKFFAAFFQSLRKIEIGLLDEGLYLFLSDFDECNNGSHDCHSNATCLNTPGYFECKCKDGYIGDGHNCTGRDQLSSLSSAFIWSIFDHATSKYYISAVIYSAIQSYTLLKRAKIQLSEKNYLGLRKPIISPPPPKKKKKKSMHSSA